MSVPLSRNREIMPMGYGMQGAGAQVPGAQVPGMQGSAPPLTNPAMMGASAPPMGAQPYPQKPPYAAQPYNSTAAYGQPPMSQPQYGAPPPQPYSNGMYPPQPYAQAGGPVGYQAGGYQQAGGPMGYQAGGFQQAGGPGMGMGGAPMGMGGMGMAPGGVVSLVKGGNMSLSKAVPNLRNIKVGLGWDVRQTPGAPFDLDASIFLLKGDGRVRMAQDLIFYNNRQSIDGAVFHNGDNLTGMGEGDDETISVDLTRVPPDIQKIVCVVSIYEAEARGQNFGMVNRAFIRVVNAENNMEIVRFDLTEEASMFSCMVFGELYRYNNEWKFRAIGQGVPGGLRACGPMFGIAMQ